MHCRRPEVVPTVIALKQQSLSHKLIACELERLGYLNARGECYSVESIKKIIRDAARSLELEAWPLSPG